MEKSVIFKTLGKNIKNARLMNNLSQESLADQLNKSVNFVSLVERGQSGVSIETLVQFCNILGVSSDSLLMGLVNLDKSDDQTYIMNCISAFSEQDTKIIVDLINYIRESRN